MASRSPTAGRHHPSATQKSLMGVSSLVTRFRTALRTHGPRRTARLLGSRLHREFFPPPLPTHPFDLKHGVHTSGLLFADQLASGHAHDDHINAYWGTPPSGFHGILDLWRQTLAGTPYSFADYTFLDIGSGKGRVVMMASQAPFHRVVGVELNPELNSIAESNLAKWRTSPHACGDIAVLNLDALAAPIPDSPSVLYIYNSFNLYVMLPLLERLQALALTRATPIDLIYAQPQQAALVDAMPGIAILGAGSIELSPEDRAADAFATSRLNYRIYRLANRQGQLD
jgi:SAM-dependent methyltransferase